jgi:hypothetical protein
MKLPIIRGIVRRHLMLNYRVDPEVMRRWLPAPFEPDVYRDWAIAGVCLLRVERVPARLRIGRGLTGEHAAHRVAVRWLDGNREHEGVYVHRSDTGSLIEHLTGARIVPGESRRARFRVEDDGRAIRFVMRSLDRKAEVQFSGHAAAVMPPSSIFPSIREASEFFARGSVGYAVASAGAPPEGIVTEWSDRAVHPLAVTRVRCAIFEDTSMFPAGSVEFDHALVLRDVEHVWRRAPELARKRGGTVSQQPASNR